MTFCSSGVSFSERDGKHLPDVAYIPSKTTIPFLNSVDFVRFIVRACELDGLGFCFLQTQALDGVGVVQVGGLSSGAFLYDYTAPIWTVAYYCSLLPILTAHVVISRHSLLKRSVQLRPDEWER